MNGLLINLLGNLFNIVTYIGNCRVSRISHTHPIIRGGSQPTVIAIHGNHYNIRYVYIGKRYIIITDRPVVETKQRVAGRSSSVLSDIRGHIRLLYGKCR